MYSTVFNWYIYAFYRIFNPQSTYQIFITIDYDYNYQLQNQEETAESYVLRNEMNDTIK